jgi:DNA-binding beta-propeller fold protein YncE
MSSVVSKGRNSLLLACACTLVLSAASLHAQKVIATIPVSGFVGGGAVDPIARRAYIPVGNNGPNGRVAVINERTNAVVAYINLNTPWPADSAALNPLTGLLYVGAETGGLFVIDPRTYATVGFVNVNAASVALNPVTDTIYASDFNSTLYVIDGATLNIETTISVNGIQNIAVNPFNDRIYAAIQNFIVGGVAVIDGATNQIIAQPPAGSGLSFAVAVDPAKNAFYSAEQFGTVTVYNWVTNAQVKAIAISGQPSGLAEDPFTHTIYVSNYQTNAVDLIDGSTYAVTGSAAVGTQPEYMTDDPADKLLYVGCQGVDASGNPTFSISVIKTK